MKIITINPADDPEKIIKEIMDVQKCTRELAENILDQTLIDMMPPGQFEDLKKELKRDLDERQKI